MKDYRVEIAVKNNRILTYMEQMGFDSIAEFCRHTKLSQTWVGQMINFKRKAVYDNGEWKPEAIRVANALACEPSDLWTEEQRNAALDNNKKALFIAEEEMSKIIEHNQETDMLFKECSDTIANILLTLKPIEQTTIQMRYGLSPYTQPYTLEQIGAEVDLTRERVRQIEVSAMERLQHPANKKKLLDFIPEQSTKKISQEKNACNI
jgi:RNA polymerase sigma factor (sigma-70 family)